MHPVKVDLQGFLLLLNSGDIPPNGQSDSHDNPHDPHAHVADVEVAEKRFHGLAMLSDSA